MSSIVRYIRFNGADYNVGQGSVKQEVISGSIPTVAGSICQRWASQAMLIRSFLGGNVKT